MGNSEKPTQNQIADYLKWLKAPEGGAHLQMPLPLGCAIAAEAVSACPENVIMLNRNQHTTPTKNARLSESEGKSRIRCLAIAGHGTNEIARRTGCHPKYIENVLNSPGRHDRRYE